jgi:hypothetical protein
MNRYQTERSFNVYYGMDLNCALSGGTLVTGSDRGYMLNPFLDMATQFTGTSVTITGIWTVNNLIDSWCFGNTNATQYRLRLFDQAGTLLFDTGSNYLLAQAPNRKIKAQNGSYIIVQPSAAFRTIDDLAIFIETLKNDVYNARRFELTLTAAAPIFIGNLFVGLKTQLPRPGTSISDDIQLFSESAVSHGGHVHGSRGVYTEGFSCDFPVITADDRKILRQYLIEVQDVVPHYVDPFGLNREDFEPIYGALSESELSLAKLTVPDGGYYSTSLTWRGSR